MAPERVESDFGLQGWIDTLGLKQSLFQQVSELWRISYKLTKEFAHPEFRGPLRVASTTKARLENFKINMPLINALCTPGIKDRHWEAMSVKVQYSLSDIEIVNITIFMERFFNKAFEDIAGCAQVFPIELLERWLTRKRLLRRLTKMLISSSLHRYLRWLAKKPCSPSSANHN